MRKAIAGAITLTTLTVAVQSIAQTPPPAPVMPPSLPAAHVVNLMTNEGSGAFGVQWRVADIKMVEVLVWRFRSPHHSCGELDCGLLNQSHTRIKGLLVSFDSEIRK